MVATGSRSLEVLLIGVDACCHRVLAPLIEEDRVPHLQSIIEDGISDQLISQVPPWTASAWPTIYTGTNPGKHGVFDFLTYDGYDWGVVDARCVREHAIWELLDHHNRSSVVVNVPVTHPPSAFNGALLPGFTAPADPSCHPTGLLDNVRSAIGDYRVYPTPGDDLDHVPEYLECIQMRGEAFRYLVEKYDPDFGFLQFQATDTVFHQYSHEETDVIAAVYEAVDAEIGRTLAQVDPSMIMIIGDHGIGPYRGTEFRVNEFLSEHGYLETSRGGKGMPSWQLMRDQRLRKGDEETSRELTHTERLVGVAARAGLTTTHIRRMLERVHLDGLARRHAPAGVVRVSDRQVDFPNSMAYMRSRVETGIRMNVEGRDPAGKIDPAEYESVRASLIDLLEDVQSPSGDPIFESVDPVESHFSGPFVEQAVDIVTVPNNWDHFLSAQLPGDCFGEPAEPWNHKLETLIAATGSGIDARETLAGAHIRDIAPTILAALGIPISDRMDGRSLPIVDTTETMTYPTYDGKQSVGSADRDVERRLAALGYLD